MNIKAKNWIFITLALTIGGGGSLDINAKNNDGKTPYDFLLYNDALKDNEEAIALLNPSS